MKDLSKASTGIYLDTRRAKQDGSYPVKIRVTHERSSKFYTTKISMSKAEFKKAMDSRSRGDLKDLRMDLTNAEQKAIDVIKGMEDFSFEEFDRLFLNRKGNSKDLYTAFKERISNLEREKKFSTALTYNNALSSLKKFHNKTSLSYKNVNQAFLYKYENWMLKSGKSETTISIYLRTVRFLFNRAINRGDIKEGLYPFGRVIDGKYEIPQPRNIKKALKTADIKKILEYKPEEGSNEQYYGDLWIFSYLCNGINMKDIALLKYSDIKGDRIYFRRAKTKTTSRKSKPIEVFISTRVKQIISRWGVKEESPDTYIFDILDKEMGDERIHKRIKSVTRMMNKKLKDIAKELEIDVELTTYTARHSYATMLKRKGAPNSFIGDSLGHSNIKTTENYFDSFEDEDKKKWADALTDLG